MVRLELIRYYMNVPGKEKDPEAVTIRYFSVKADVTPAINALSLKACISGHAVIKLLCNNLSTEDKILICRLYYYQVFTITEQVLKTGK